MIEHDKNLASKTDKPYYCLACKIGIDAMPDGRDPRCPKCHLRDLVVRIEQAKQDRDRREE